MQSSITIGAFPDAAVGAVSEDGRKHEGGSMSTEAANALLDRLESDQEFRERIVSGVTSAPSDEARLQVVRDAGYDIDRTDVPVVRARYDVHELSDEDLHNVAGGGATGTIVGSIGTAVIGGIAAAAAFVCV
jgi:predicted ribosomally synthesized peptide with nif11-like leader